MNRWREKKKQLKRGRLYYFILFFEFYKFKVKLERTHLRVETCGARNMLHNNKYLTRFKCLSYWWMDCKNWIKVEVEVDGS